MGRRVTRRNFSRDNRIRRQADFDRAYKTKVYAADDVLVVNASLNGLTVARLGLSVSRKVGNAVMRNKWKRRIREAFRLQQEKFPPGLDIVVRPKLGAACDFHAIARSLPQLVARIIRRLPPPDNASAADPAAEAGP